MVEKLNSAGSYTYRIGVPAVGFVHQLFCFFPVFLVASVIYQQNFTGNTALSGVASATAGISPVRKDYLWKE